MFSASFFQFIVREYYAYNALPFTIDRINITPCI